MVRKTESGQLLLPILGVLFLFGMFWVPYVLWCRTIYWTMRMDAAADLAALSAARQEAALLNYLATYQTAENAFLPEIKGYGVMEVSMKGDFESLNQILRIYKQSFGTHVLAVAQKVASANGSNRPIFPTTDSSLSENTDAHLRPHKVRVLFLASGWPVGSRVYPEAYYTRDWQENLIHAQPTHKNYWTVCRDTTCGEGRAKLWLDVDPSSALNDGGFPSEKVSFLRSIGIQCFYPQFNACLLPKR